MEYGNSYLSVTVNVRKKACEENRWTLGASQ